MEDFRMFDTFVHVAFWTVFSIPALAALLFLAGTFMASDRLTTARHYDDRGEGDPRSEALYALAMRSNRLATLSLIAFMPLAGAGVLAFAGSTVLSALVAIALASVTMVIGDALRTRHAGLDRTFEGVTGEPILETYLKVIGPRADRSAQT
jgi:hypothetical protein